MEDRLWMLRVIVSGVWEKVKRLILSFFVLGFPNMQFEKLNLKVNPGFVWELLGFITSADQHWGLFVDLLFATAGIHHLPLPTPRPSFGRLPPPSLQRQFPSSATAPCFSHASTPCMGSARPCHLQPQNPLLFQMKQSKPNSLSNCMDSLSFCNRISYTVYLPVTSKKPNVVPLSTYLYICQLRIR